MKNWILTKHEQIHIWEKPFRCQKCGRNFDLKSELTKHEKIHTDWLNPFSLAWCNNNASWFIKTLVKLIYVYLCSFKILSKTNHSPFFRHYDALAVGFSATFCHNGSNWSSQKTVSFMCSLVTNQLLTDRKGAPQIVNNNLLWGVSDPTFFHSCVQ